jgi:D-3-phosphoglycerate dehydrogenase
MTRFKVAMSETVNRDLSSESTFFAEHDVEFIKVPGASEEEMIEGARDCDALIVILAQVTPALISSMERCKVIVRRGIGIDNIDLESAAKRKIMVANVPDYCHFEVAEHTWSLFLSLCRKIPDSAISVRAGKWDKNIIKPIPRLAGKSFGILGCGAIGRNVAKKAAAFDMTVYGYDPFVAKDILQNAHITPVGNLEEFLGLVDFLSLHSPLTPETHHIINEKTLKLMRQSCLLINASRGGLIDEAALYAALRDKAIAGAALDVLTEEPPKEGHFLVSLENVIITPHIAFYSAESEIDLAIKTAEEVWRTLTEGRPKHWVNKDWF